MRNRYRVPLISPAVSYTYDANANLTRRVTPASETISYAYDARNRLASVVTPSETRTYTYDRVGRVLTAANALGMLTHVYDARGRLAQVTAPGAKTVGYGYDAANNRTRLTYPTALNVTYTYDALNRLISQTDLNAQTITLGYSPLSERTSLTLPNGVATTSAYDAASQLTTLTTAKSGVTLAGFSYAYDALGNRAAETRQPASVSATYTYDATSQLTAVSAPAASYAYDAAGNRTTAAGLTYTANVLNQYTQVGAASLTYDLKGNLLSDGTQTYTYDAENRLTRVVRGATTVLYTYDALGRRASRSVNGVVTTFLYDGADLAVETDAAGTVTAQYLFGPRIDEPLELKRGTTTSYYAADALGSIVALTTSTGALVETVTYDAFGLPTLKNAGGVVLAASTVGNRFLFTAREWEAEVGLCYYRARYYSPTLGRFLQRDLASGDAHSYRYVFNNPGRWIDPWGWNIFGIQLPISRPPDDIGTRGPGLPIDRPIPQPEPPIEWTPPILSGPSAPDVLPVPPPTTEAGNKESSGKFTGEDRPGANFARSKESGNQEKRPKKGDRKGKGKDIKQVDDVGKIFGMDEETRSEFGRYIEEAKEGRDFTYQELVEKAKEFLGLH